jgi:hypothetical protein
MKHVKKFKLYESPDEVFNQKLRSKSKDANVYKKAIGFRSTDAITFGYYNDEMKVSPKGKEYTHNDMHGRSNMKYAGRLWADRKLITFWEYPETYEKLEQILRDIQEAYIKPDRRRRLNIMDNLDKWKIETGYEDWDDKKFFDKQYNYTDAFYNQSIIIPVTEYKEGKGWTAEQKAKAHVADWKERERLKKLGIIKLAKGFGSTKGTEEVQKADSIANPGQKMTMAQYNDIKKKYMGESYIMKFETYNTHVVANPDSINTVPVTDYVDLDYFGTDVEMDEKEPPNATGRDDREVKNKTKKAVSKLSVESISIKKFEDYNVQDMMSIPTSITRGNEYTEDPLGDYTTSLQPYYDFIKSLTGIKDLSQITHEQLDQYVGFSFVAYYLKVMILSDKNNVHMLINKDLIPLESPNEIIKILESEA